MGDATGEIVVLELTVDEPDGPDSFSVLSGPSKNSMVAQLRTFPTMAVMMP